MLIWIFSISFILCVFMITMRVVELEYRKVFVVTKFLNTINFSLEDKIAQLKVKAAILKQETIFFITHHVPFHMFNHAHKMTRGLRARYTNIERAVRGRQAIKQNGQASAFLKDIVDHKNSLGKN